MIRMLLLAIGIFILLALLVSPPRARAEATDSSRTHTTVIDGQWQRIQPTCNPYQAWQPRPQYYYGNHELAARQAARPRDPQSFRRSSFHWGFLPKLGSIFLGPHGGSLRLELPRASGR
jgi:hypothetical protein